MFPQCNIKRDHMITTIIDTGLPVRIISLFSPSNLKMHPVNYYVTLLLLLVAVPVFPRVDFPFLFL